MQYSQQHQIKEENTISNIESLKKKQEEEYKQLLIAQKIARKKLRRQIQNKGRRNSQIGSDL